MCRIFVFIIQFSNIHRIVHLKPPWTKWKFLLNMGHLFLSMYYVPSITPSILYIQSNLTLISLFRKIIILLTLCMTKLYFTEEVTCTHTHTYTQTHTHKELTTNLLEFEPRPVKTPKSDHNCASRYIKCFMCNVYVNTLNTKYSKNILCLCVHAKL